MEIKTRTKNFLGDCLNTINLYYILRRRYSRVFLLESSDYHARENSTTLICFDCLADISVTDGTAVTRMGSETHGEPVVDIADSIHGFMQTFRFSSAPEDGNGIFGYCGFDAVEYFDTHTLTSPKKDDIPAVHYSFFRYILRINSFDNSCTLIENCPAEERFGLEQVYSLLFSSAAESPEFKLAGEEQSSMSDEEYMNMVRQGKKHCQRGDVFQIVLSRRFEQPFTGDDFQVYRALRAINPSPYLFCFNLGDFRIMGSSPEAEVIIKNREAELHPIAGTYGRSGDDEYDKKRAFELSQDPKESAEHVMLVDLARNDMSRNCRNVTVKRFKEVQYFSHVIHLVSRVIGELNSPDEAVKVLGDTFPAGTLSGAPKYRAVELIDYYEPHRRGYYGGALGYIGFNGDLNHAITIRSFLSKDGILHYQAGAGVVISSVEEREKDEVNHKLAALKKALKTAEDL
jgi:anthranilate synthase component 1